jgi:alpha-amylase
MLRRPAFAPIILCAALLALTLTTSAAAQSVQATPRAHSSTAASGVYYEIFVRSWYDTNNDGIASPKSSTT